MALALIDFTGFETGGLEEASATNGSPSVQGTTKRTGSFALQLGSGDYVWLTPWDPTPANDVLFGLAVRFSSLSPSTEAEFFRALPVGGTRNFGLVLETDGDCRVIGASGTLDTITSPFTVNQWHFIEIRHEAADNGAYTVQIDGVLKSYGTGDQYDLGLTRRGAFYNNGSGVTIYFDDYYHYNGATGGGLGSGTEVLGAYQNTVEDATDQGTTLDQGTWADTGDTPLDEESTPAGYTGGVADGHTLFDDADSNLRPGPDGDPNCDGTIKGIKYLWWLKRGGGGGTVHYIRYGHNGDTTSEEVAVSNSYAAFIKILEASDARCPTSSESAAMGMAKDGGARDLLNAEMWAQLLHVAPSGITVTPGPASAIASAQNPSVVLGSMSMTPGVASSKANAQDPTVVLGSISLTPATASALANCQDPGVIMGSINITPAVAQAIASALDPAVIMSSMIMTPAVASAIATAQDPGVVLGSISITPAVASSIAQAIDPTVQIGDIFVTPGTAGAIAAAQDPAVILGSMSVTPAVAQAIAETLDPDVILGDITLSPDPASAIAEALDPGVILGSITLTPAVAQALVSAIDPAVVLDSMVVTPGVASAIAQALDPTVYEGDVTLTPGAASAIAKALDPTVVITGGPEVGRWPIINLIWTFGVMGKQEE